MAKKVKIKPVSGSSLGYKYKVIVDFPGSGTGYTYNYYKTKSAATKGANFVRKRKE